MVEIIDDLPDRDGETYAVVNVETNEVTNFIELVDQDTIPPIPLESEKPVMPAKPIFTDAPKAPTLTSTADEKFVKAMADAHEKKFLEWEDECAAKLAQYQADIESYNVQANEFNERYRAATRYRWEPPEGSMIVKIPAGFIASLGTTQYKNGELVNPDVAEELGA